MVLIFSISILLFLFLEILYFKIANHFNIIDKPNQRSSHTQITLRGGAIIFPIALIIGILFFQPNQYYLAIAVFAIATISFLDDIITLNNKLRIGVHLLSVLLILFQVFINQEIPILSLFNLVSCLLILVSIVLIIGIINAYNFMDGINGITVLYSIVSLISIWMVQISLGFNLLQNEIWIVLLAALIVFGFFNLRKKAKTFAGDVGSISIALIICYLIIMLMVKTNDLKWLLLLGVYGLDAVATIFCRIIRKENIFDAHRSHFYQYLANDLKINHVLIASGYAITQAVLNLMIIFYSDAWSYTSFLLIIIVYIITRLNFEGKNRLFKSY
ncbi:glycosyl transferase family 4 [Pedobacter alpinus]|uniref:Glycosyl transferase family 4 n=1 Tax=Pedobacter alpinus TaxID=1590643 RepID=A0ABW5TR71_9SPHI